MKHLIFGFLGLLLLAPLKVIAVPVLNLVPDKATLYIGETVTVDIFIEGAVDLYGLQFDAKFNPAVANSVAVSSANLLSDGSAFFDGIVFNDEVQFISDTVIGPSPGFSGTGLFASWTLLASSAGSLELEINDLFALDSSLVEITGFQMREIHVNVLPASAIPEPSTVMLISIGLFGVFAIGRSRS